jgi:hypothetical protein
VSTNEPSFDVNNIWRDIPPGAPFRNAIAKFREIFRAKLLKEPERTTALANIEPYRGRGKNYNYPFIRRIESRQDNRSKYEPHQGFRECSRRIRTLDAAWA